MKLSPRREVALLILPALCLMLIGFYLRQRERILQSQLRMESQTSEPQITKIQWSVPINQGIAGPVRVFDMQMTWKGIPPAWWGKPLATPRIISMIPLNCDGRNVKQKLHFAGGGAGWFYEDKNVYRAENYFTTGKNGTWPSCVEARFAFMNDLGNKPVIVHKVPIRLRFRNNGEVKILK
jgi:hypothetical protein